MSDDEVEEDNANPANNLKKREKSFLRVFQTCPPTFYIGGNNGAALVESTLSQMGWKRVQDKHAEIKLRWTESKNAINYGNFKEGEQLVNHISNCSLITNKLGLLLSLREHERVTCVVKNRPPKLRMNDFVPETYVIDDRNEREAFFESFKDGDIWINKPVGLNQGKGIYLVRSIDDARKELDTRDAEINNSKRFRRPMGRIIQKYIRNPLLIEGCKFDIRSFMLIASTAPFLVLYCPGYVRRSMYRYCSSAEDLTVHLTNQYIQKKDPGYENNKNDTVWSMEMFSDYIESNLASKNFVEPNWCQNVMERQIKRITSHIFAAVKNKLAARIGYFELYGLDFMVDSSMKIWLIEVNTNPAMTINCDLLKSILPPVIDETLRISIECFDKSRKSQSLLPVKSAVKFQVIHHASGQRRNPQGATTTPLRYMVASRYRASSVSPKRERESVRQPPTSVEAPDHLLPTNDLYSLLQPAYRRTTNHANQRPHPTVEVNIFRTFENSLRRYKRITAVPSSASTGAVTQRGGISQLYNSTRTTLAAAASSLTKNALQQSVGDNSQSASIDATMSIEDLVRDAAKPSDITSRLPLIESQDDPSLPPAEIGSLRMCLPPTTTRVSPRQPRRIAAPISTVRVVSTDELRLRMAHSRQQSGHCG